MTDTAISPERSYGLRKCPECPKQFTRTSPVQVFCCTAHQKAFHDRNARRGKVALPFVQTMRKGKNGRSENSSYALKQLSLLADQWNTEDRLAGRDPEIVVENKRELAWTAADVG